MPKKEDYMDNVLIFKNPFKKDEEIKELIIKLSMQALQKKELLNPRVYIENNKDNGEWFIFPMFSSNDDEKTNFWDTMFDYIKNTNRTRLYFAGDFRTTEIDTGKKVDALVVLYADKNGNYETYSFPYTKKFLKGIAFEEMQKSDMEFWWFKDILDFWKKK